MKSLRLLFVLAWIAMTTACAVNPVTGKQEISLIPESQELALGAEQYLPAQQSQGGLYKVDADVGEYVSRVGQRLADVSDRELPYEFVVINDSTPNAWALPGGKIAVNRGLLTELSSEAELAAVLGHEIVHAAARHGAKAMERGLMLQSVVLATSVGAADNDYANYIVGGAKLGAQLIHQSYGRDAELEADYYGMHYMKRAGYNPEEAVSLQETFVELSKGNKTGWLDGLLASHPPSRERVEANRETARELGTSGDVGADRYNATMARLYDTQEAYAAFDQATGLAREGHLDDALSFIDRAISKEPAEPRFYGLKGDILLEQEKYEAASKEYDRALVRDDGYYEYYLGRGLAFAELGQRDRARRDLERSNQLLTTAIATTRLGELALADGNRAEAKSYFETAMAAGGEAGDRARNTYTKLDFPDRPNYYLFARPILTENRLFLAQIANPIPFRVEDVQVEFTITVNGEQRRKVIPIALGPNERGRLTSAMKFAEDDVLESPTVRIIGARLIDPEMKPGG